MKTRYLKFAIFIIWCVLIIQPKVSHAQEKNEGSLFVDETPNYKKWKPRYIITKIVYTNTETIFHFTFNAKEKNTGAATFYPSKHKYEWVIVDHENKMAYRAKSVQKIKRDDKLVHERLGNEITSVPMKGKDCTFTCEIHFERFPENTKVVDLVEGLGQEKNKRHFNCFEIELKYRTPPIEED